MRISDWSSDVCSSDLVPPSRSPQPSWLPDLSSCVKSGQGVCAIGPQKDRIESQRRSSGRLGVTPSRIERAIGVGNQRGRAGEGTRKPRVRALLPRERRSEEHTTELKSQMRNYYDVFCSTKTNTDYR